MATPSRQPDPASRHASAFPELHGALRAIVAVPKSELDAMRRKAPKRKPQASKRKAK